MPQETADSDLYHELDDGIRRKFVLSQIGGRVRRVRKVGGGVAFVGGLVLDFESGDVVGEGGGDSGGETGKIAATDICHSAHVTTCSIYKQ